MVLPTVTIAIKLHDSFTIYQFSNVQSLISMIFVKKQCVLQFKIL